MAFEASCFAVILNMQQKIISHFQHTKHPCNFMYVCNVLKTTVESLFKISDALLFDKPVAVPTKWVQLDNAQLEGSTPTTPTA